MARAAGAMVTYNDLRDMVYFEGYTLVETIPISGRALNKVEIQTYILCDFTGSYANNQLIPYERIIKRLPPNPDPVGGYFQVGAGFTSHSSACGTGGGLIKLYHNGTGVLPEVGARLYTSSSFIGVYNGYNQFFYVLHKDATVQVNNLGYVISVTYCTDV